MPVNSSSILTYWGLQANPYDIQGSHGQSIAITDSMRQVQQFITRQASAGGTSAVLGEIGDGKTTALRFAKRALAKEPSRFLTVTPATLSTGSLSPATMIRLIYDAHGTYAPRTSCSAGKIASLIGLIEAIDTQTVIILDEAHLLHVSLIRMVKEMADASPKISIILVGHKMPFLTRLKKLDSQDVTKRLEIGRILTPPPLSIEDARRIVDQRRSIMPSCPEIPDDLLKEILAHKANPLGLLSICWHLLEEGAIQRERAMSIKLLRGYMGRSELITGGKGSHKTRLAL